MTPQEIYYKHRPRILEHLTKLTAHLPNGERQEANTIIYKLMMQNKPVKIHNTQTKLL